MAVITHYNDESTTLRSSLLIRPQSTYQLFRVVALSKVEIVITLWIFLEGVELLATLSCHDCEQKSVCVEDDIDFHLQNTKEKEYTNLKLQ